MADRNELQSKAAEAIENFRQNRMFQRLDSGAMTKADYHSLLLMIFPQTFEVPGTFALAGVNCSARFQQVKEYLFHHADEEKTHWQWVIDDLKNTGYTGEDPRQLFPRPACQSYISFNYYTALKMPVARLAIATVLEGIGAQYGREYGARLFKALNLKPEQATFFLRHGETDREHIIELWKVIDSCELTENEWQWMCHAARMAGLLYKAMYDEAAQ